MSDAPKPAASALDGVPAIGDDIPAAGAAEGRGASARASGTDAAEAARDPTEALSATTTALALAVVLLAVLPFVTAAVGPFLFDDEVLIARNPFVHELSHWSRWFTHDFWDVSPDPEAHASRIVYWRPLVLASYAVDWQLWLGHPLGFHLTNLLLQAAVGLLAFVVLRRYVGEPLPAAAGAALFAVHPTKAESVAWISGRTDLLVTLGLFLAVQGMARRLRGARGGIPLEVLGTAWAYLAKEVAVLLPVLAAVEAWIAAGRPRIGAVGARRWANAVGPQVLAGLGYVGGRALLGIPVQRAMGGSSPALVFWSALDGVGRAWATLVWPSDLSLGGAQVELAVDRAPPLGFAVVGALVLGALLAIVVLTWRRSPTVAVGTLTTAAFLTPSLWLAASGNSVTTAARMLYLPVFPLAWLAAELGRVALTRRARGYFAVVGLLLVAWSSRAFIRARDFTDERRFWGYELRRNPEYGPALQHFIGVALREGRPRAALALAHRCFVQSARTGSLAIRGSAITRSIDAVLRITPDRDRETLRSIQGFVRAVLERRAAELSAPSLGLRVAVVPASPEASSLRGDAVRLLVAEADAASRLGDDPAATTACRAALARCPTCSQNLRTLVLAATRTGDLALAAEVLEVLGASASEAERDATAAFLAEARRRQVAMRSPGELPARLARARFFALCAAWGRAYDAVAPLAHAAEPLPRPTELLLGEVAFRAGDEPTARRLLGRQLPSADVDAAFSAWRLQMRWVDAPEPAH